VEFGSIEKQARIPAAPDIVYEVVSRPEHIRRWWALDADFDPTAGGSGAITFPNQTVRLTVIEAVPPSRFRFRWNYPDGTAPSSTNGTLVTFDIVPDGDGSLLTVTEEGLREQGWEAAKLEAFYLDHLDGWTTCLDRLIPAYVAELTD
jgi:uncharacterized protein YndB with AHSA1/START domain